MLSEERESRKGSKSFLIYVFKDVSFPPECGDRSKIKTSSSDIWSLSALVVFSFSLPRSYY